jgi:hypothetical protein
LRLEGLGKLKNPMTSSGMNRVLPACIIASNEKAPLNKLSSNHLRWFLALFDESLLKIN